MTIEEFIAARLADDEADAERARSKANGPGGDGVLWVVTGMDNAVGVFYDPARELRTAAAIRTLTVGHEPIRFGDEPSDSCAACSHDIADGFHYEPWPCASARIVASIWSNHSDYRPEWDTPDQA